MNWKKNKRIQTLGRLAEIYQVRQKTKKKIWAKWCHEHLSIQRRRRSSGVMGYVMLTLFELRLDEDKLYVKKEVIAMVPNLYENL